MITNLNWTESIQYLREVYGVLPKHYKLPYDTGLQCYNLHDIMPILGGGDTSKIFIFIPFDFVSEGEKWNFKGGLYSFLELEELNSLYISPTDYDKNGLKFARSSMPIVFYTLF